MTLGAAPAMAFAEETQESKCSHIHDESCGYREEQDESPVTRTARIRTAITLWIIPLNALTPRL